MKFLCRYIATTISPYYNLRLHCKLRLKAHHRWYRDHLHVSVHSSNFLPYFRVYDSLVSSAGTKLGALLVHFLPPNSYRKYEWFKGDDTTTVLNSDETDKTYTTPQLFYDNDKDNTYR